MYLFSVAVVMVLEKPDYEPGKFLSCICVSYPHTHGEDG